MLFGGLVALLGWLGVLVCLALLAAAGLLAAAAGTAGASRFVQGTLDDLFGQQLFEGDLFDHPLHAESLEPLAGIAGLQRGAQPHG